MVVRSLKLFAVEITNSRLIHKYLYGHVSIKTLNHRTTFTCIHSFFFHSFALSEHLSAKDNDFSTFHH